jgi:lipoprotein NlpI
MFIDESDLDRAIGDFDAAIRLDPRSVKALSGRATAFKAKGLMDRAMADYTEAINLDAKRFIPLFGRGQLLLYRGAFAQARSDLQQALSLAPESAYPYVVLFLDLVERHSGLPSRIGELARRVDTRGWPAPVIHYFAGELSLRQLLGAAADTNPKIQTDQMCEANFYSSELALSQGHKQDAIDGLERASRDCPRSFIEREGAEAELQVLR